MRVINVLNVDENSSPDLIAWAVQTNPWYAVQNFPHRLRREQLDWCVKRIPSTTLQYAAAYLSDEQIEACARQNP